MIWLLLTAASPTFDADDRFCQIDAARQGYTLCLAEREHDRADKKLNAQWRATFRHVRVNRGPIAARRLREEQRNWIKATDSRCEAEAAPTPTTQQGRNYVSCLTKFTDQQTATLRRMAEGK